MTVNFSLIAKLHIKLFLTKVAKLEACIRPLFANLVTYQDSLCVRCVPCKHCSKQCGRCDFHQQTACVLYQLLSVCATYIEKNKLMSYHLKSRHMLILYGISYTTATYVHTALCKKVSTKFINLHEQFINLREQFMNIREQFTNSLQYFWPVCKHTYKSNVQTEHLQSVRKGSRSVCKPVTKLRKLFCNT